MYPLKFTKVLKEKVWGGRDLERLFSIPLAPGRTFGESWEVSVHPNGPSVVAGGPWSGRSLPDLVKECGPRLLGMRVARWSRGEFPLLIKYLDVHDKLSIQVHPDDAYAQVHEGGLGKSECWYVFDASPDAKLILGVAPGVTKDEFEHRARAGRWNGLFREVPVAAGDFVAIRPGTVHASLSGSVVLCEVQQNSDTTYRIYDFDRFENGVPRPLHLDRALDVIAFGAEPQVSRKGTRTSVEMNGGRYERLVADPLFRVDLVSVETEWACPGIDQFQVFSVVGGRGGIRWDGGASEVVAGETWLLPANVSANWRGPLQFVLSTVDAP